MGQLKPVRVRFTCDDPAELWREGQTADDLGPESPGSSVHLFRLDHFDDAKVSLEDPYARGLVERLDQEHEQADIPFVMEATDEVPDPADRCARCSHVYVQHMPEGGSCGACGCMRYERGETDR